jgi:hypothetical protein
VSCEVGTEVLNVVRIYEMFAIGSCKFITILDEYVKITMQFI